jgi:hypothetical protein
LPHFWLKIAGKLVSIAWLGYYLSIRSCCRDPSMEIQSAFASGLQGLQRASNGITEASVNINRDAVNQQRAQNAQESRAATARPEPVVTAEKTPALAQSLVQLASESVYAESNVRTIKSADEMLGTIIDVSA